LIYGIKMQIVERWCWTVLSYKGWDLVSFGNPYRTWLYIPLKRCLCHSFSALLSWLVEYHLPGVIVVLSSLLKLTWVPKPNIASERDFAKLHRLLHEKPNATTLLLEAMVILSNNRTMKWLNSKPAEEVQHLLQHARKKGCKI